MYMSGRNVATAIGIAALVGVALLAPSWLIELVAYGLARGIAVLGVFVIWRCGLASFGHALYFGVAAYSVAFLDRKLGINDLLLRAVCGLVTAGILGFAIGFVMRRYRGIPFAMLNLALSMLFYGLVIRSTALGSTDGFVLSRATLLGYSPSRLLVFLVIAATAGVLVFLVSAYLNSTAGHLAKAIKDNELRLEFLGLSGQGAVHAKYTLSAVLCGIGGAFAASLLSQVDPDSMVNWTISGELVLITVLAGTTSALAPIVVSIAFELIRSYALDIAPYAWQLLFGLCLIGAILWRPNGLWPMFTRRRAA
jgi:branched-chain amino acid transport system permease protein